MCTALLYYETYGYPPEKCQVSSLNSIELMLNPDKKKKAKGSNTKKWRVYVLVHCTSPPVKFLVSSLNSFGLMLQTRKCGQREIRMDEQSGDSLSVSIKNYDQLLSFQNGNSKTL